MNSNKRNQTIRPLIALSTGLTLSMSMLCAPSISYAGGAPTVAAAQAQAPKSNRFRKVVVGGVVAAAVLGGGIGTKVTVSKLNDLSTMKEQTLGVLSDLGAEEQRRADMIPNLLVVAKSTAKFEQATYSKIAEGLGSAAMAIKSANASGSPAQQVAASVQMSNAMMPLITMQNQYPELKASGQFASVMQDIKSTEDRINIGRQRYNRAVVAYNSELVRIPGKWVAGLGDGLSKLPLFQVQEAAKNAPVLKVE